MCSVNKEPTLTVTPQKPSTKNNEFSYYGN
jgi:hypothetical protein